MGRYRGYGHLRTVAETRRNAVFVFLIVAVIGVCVQPEGKA